MENEVVVGTKASQICSNIFRPTSGKDVVNENEDSDEYDPDSSSSENDSDVVFNDSDYNFSVDDDNFEANVDDDVEFVGLSNKAEIDQSYAQTIEKLANIDGDCDGGSFSELSSGESSCDEQVGPSKKVKYQVFNEKTDMQNPRFAVEEIMKSDPGTRVIIKAKPMVGCDNKNKFKRLYICWGPLKKGLLEGCRPVIGFDGCHLKGPHGGILLTALGIDANNYIHSFAYTVVEKEKRKTWQWFLELIKEDLDTVNSWMDFYE
ncbi:hypothetical protein RHMOL_Rhmol01G0214500 [Rhododendron molle]|uniref:Uncharacterized protein n=1 Tax=Rhododendron molle TaxID=49168 RepID=A0ACC0Q5A7_RHOML|nr:hypothetical protein RHMOL_Rhmol01G0214500 [Rhododendron molle]